MATDETLDRARASFAREAWGDAYTQLSVADHETSLEPEDLERLATAAYLTGNETDAIAVWKRAYHDLVQRDEVQRAARCGFWLAHSLLLMGEGARSNGWLAQTRRLLDHGELDYVEQGYLRVVDSLLALGGGDAAGSDAINRQIIKTAERFEDPDLLAFGLLGRGKALVELGDSPEAVGLLDEAMAAVVGGEVSPVVAGFVYCAVILTCRKIYDIGRAQEWTAALYDWCKSQPDLVLFRGQCLVHRSEIMQLRGDWGAAMEEVQRACDWLSEPPQPALAMAFYQRGELHRLRGELERAEQAYREAGQRGWEPQPGLALLRLAEGRTDAAEASIRRVMEELDDPLERSRMLGAYVRIMLAAADFEAARAGADELSEIAALVDSPYLDAVSAQARGVVLLAEDAAQAALGALREASNAWQELGAAYETARVQVQMALACRQLGDHESAEMKLEAARRVFDQLGATPALARLAELSPSTASDAPGGLTPREVEVLELVAAGRTNREVADELVISDKTVERHLSNIFLKLDVPNRTAAAAYAHEHDLL